MFKKSKLQRVFLLTLVLVMALTTVAAAANSIYTKELTATYGRIKFKVDGKDVTSAIESKYGTPAFVVDDRSYVPVRAIAELMGLEVKYDNATHTAELIDTKSKEYEAEIKKLNDEIKKLKNEAKKEEEKKASKTDIEDLQKALNKEYGEIDNVDFSIRLKESKSKITIYIDIDTQSSSQRNAWRKMSTRVKEDIIEDIADDVYDEFEDLSISGSLYDNYQQKTLYSFSVNKSGKVSIDNEEYYYDDYRYNDLEDDAEYYLDRYIDKIAKVLDIYVRERSNGEVYGTVNIDIDRNRLYKDELEDLEDAFYDAERDLMDRYGSSVYFDIGLELDGKLYAVYYDGRLTED